MTERKRIGNRSNGFAPRQVGAPRGSGLVTFREVVNRDSESFGGRVSGTDGNSDGSARTPETSLPKRRGSVRRAGWSKPFAGKAVNAKRREHELSALSVNPTVGIVRSWSKKLPKTDTLRNNTLRNQIRNLLSSNRIAISDLTRSVERRQHSSNISHAPYRLASHHADAYLDRTYPRSPPVLPAPARRLSGTALASECCLLFASKGVGIGAIRFGVIIGFVRSLLQILRTRKWD